MRRLTGASFVRQDPTARRKKHRKAVVLCADARGQTNQKVRSMRRNIMNETLGLVIAIGFPLLGILALVYLAFVGPRNREFVDRELFVPYINAISAGYYEHAWAHYSNIHRQRHPLSEFTEHYQFLVKEYGPIVGHVIVAARRSYDPFRSQPGYVVECSIQFARTSIRTHYQIETESDGRLHIRHSGSPFARFRAQRLPW